MARYFKDGHLLPEHTASDEIVVQSDTMGENQALVVLGGDMSAQLTIDVNVTLVKVKVSRVSRQPDPLENCHLAVKKLTKT